MTIAPVPNFTPEIRNDGISLQKSPWSAFVSRCKQRYLIIFDADNKTFIKTHHALKRIHTILTTLLLSDSICLPFKVHRERIQPMRVKILLAGRVPSVKGTLQATWWGYLSLKQTVSRLVHLIRTGFYSSLFFKPSI